MQFEAAEAEAAEAKQAADDFAKEAKRVMDDLGTKVDWLAVRRRRPRALPALQHPCGLRAFSLQCHKPAAGVPSGASVERMHCEHRQAQRHSVWRAQHESTTRAVRITY